MSVNTVVTKQVAEFLLSEHGQALLVAIAADKMLQYRPKNTDKWFDHIDKGHAFPRHNLSAGSLEWRVKPEPRTLFAVRRGNESVVNVFTYRQYAEDCITHLSDRHGPYKIEEYKQVL